MDEGGSHRVLKVMVETDRRTFVGDVHMPAERNYRLSDHLNAYDKNFVCLSNVRVKDRGQEHRPGDQRDFVAISIASITYVTPLEEG